MSGFQSEAPAIEANNLENTEPEITVAVQDTVALLLQNAKDSSRAHATTIHSDHADDPRGRELNRTLHDHVATMCDAVIEQCFGTHNENILAEDEFAIGDGSYRVSIEKLGQTELLTRDVERWIADPQSKDRPPRYEDREPVNGKKLNERQFTEVVYQKLIAAKAIYLDQLRKLDKKLVKNLHKFFSDGELEMIIPTISARIDKKIQVIASKGIDVKKLSSVGQAVSRRQ